MIIELFQAIQDMFIHLSHHPIIISFISGIFSGEIAILTLSFLSAQGIFPLWISVQKTAQLQ